MNAIGYIRISTKDQSHYSLDYQQANIEDYCSRNHLTLLALFKDDGESSYTFDRPDYIALELFVKKHKGNVQYLIVMDHDRFSRNLPEALNKISLLENKFGLKVLATNEPLDLDTSDPSVFMQRAFRYLLANDELLRIRKRTKLGVRQALESGRFINMAPFGYHNSRDENGKGVIIQDECKAFIIRKIFSDFLKGESIMRIYHDVRLMGFPGKGHSAISRILENCVYAGLIRIPASKKGPEKYVKGIHKPIIEEHAYWHAQELLKRKKYRKTLISDKVPLRGVLQCASCGRNMTAGNSKGKRKYYAYYRCNIHSHVNLPAVILHEKLNNILELLSFTREQVKFIVREVKSKMQVAINDRRKVLDVKRGSLRQLADKIDKLESRLLNDEIEYETYKKWFRKLSGEKSMLISEIEKLQAELGSKWDKQELLMEHLTDFPNLWRMADIRQKHALLRQVFNNGLVFIDGSYRTPHLNLALLHNQLILKEKRLLFIDQSLENHGFTPIRTRDGN